MRNLELYRASAGSGKTYTLAKKYIWYFITVKPEDGPARLRTDSELADSARHILAVTFTNEATIEMQQRIGQSLYALATVPAEYKADKNGARVIVKPEYMREFTDALHVSPDRIAGVCRRGLAILLENYSDFNVSTIDSFFQQVLRIFAFESEINDSYQVELDSNYLSQVCVDQTLEEIDSNPSAADATFWIKTIMDRTDSSKWNMFTKSEGDSFTTNPYKSFISSVKKMETEDYKLLRPEIEEYLEGDNDFVTLYRDLCEKYETHAKRAFSVMKRAFRDLYNSLPSEITGASSRTDLGKIAGACNKILKKSLKWNADPDSSSFPKIDPNLIMKPKVQSWISDNPEYGCDVESRYNAACEAFSDWASTLTSKEFRHWNLYSTNPLYFALFGIVTSKRREFLAESNSIELGETSVLLRGVIGDSDAPFVYERLGARLNHFLIDEFQDTSRMQWDNLSPLLHESISRGNGNLIIGDAKQSIYRFRNADPSLITTVVPEEFGPQVDQKGNIPSENTNYRSDLHVVQFNNSFFDYFAKTVDEATPDPSDIRLKFKKLYSNVVQTPNKTADEGYVEIHISGNSLAQCNDQTLDALPALVDGLISRGYLQKEIAVLVSTNLEGDKVIESFVKYNASLPDGGHEIRFVSEQSLKVASSSAVALVTGVLYNMARGSRPEIRQGDERRTKGPCNWGDMMANFRFYRMNFPDKPLAEVLDDYLEQGGNFDALSDLLSEMQSLSIPALVEAVTAAFVPEELKKSDAIYIAAFQDLVLEYCESHPTDIGSFLKWWERKSVSASVSSPADTDAVQVVTVHKSKGLQYECVIVPFANWDLADVEPSEGKREWLWVKPEVVSHPEIPMPPYLPVETSGKLRGTSHEALLTHYFDVSRMDRINAAYVAFTRAKKELYIFCAAPQAPLTVDPKPRERKPSASLIGSCLYNFLTNPENIAENNREAHADGVSPLLQPSSLSIDDDPFVAKIGVRPDNVGANREASEPMTLIGAYVSTRHPGFLKYHEDDLIPDIAPDETVDEEDLDPRSEGNMKHAVLEMVKVPEDLPAAVRHLVITGAIPDSMSKGILDSLSEAVSQPMAARWFDGTARVINERPVLKGGYMTKRPDRLLIYPDGHAEVVDYKFGKIDTTGKYNRQIGEYVKRLRETGRFTAVIGYIWYVNENEIKLV